ncbi:unnamed protein product [Penicillium manginii]
MGLASISVTTASDFQSWDDIVGDAPQCIKSCLDDFYSNAGLKDECGSSDDASMNCLCNASSFTAAQSSANDLSTCIQKGCDSGDLSELSSSLSDFQDRFMDAAEQCQSGDYDKNAASTLVPGLNALLASGAVLLIGAAL